MRHPKNDASSVICVKHRSAALWWRLFVVWAVVMGLGWGIYWWRTGVVAHQQAIQQAKFLMAVRSLQGVTPFPVQNFATPSADRMLTTIRALEGDRASNAGRADARKWLKGAFEGLGWIGTEHRYPTGVNLVFRHPGDQDRKQKILLGAHYDAVPGSPGADDNASGVAVVLELARLMTDKNRELALEIVLFDEEERGLRGSSAYAEESRHLEGLDAVLIVEMVGFACHTRGCQQRPPFVPRKLFPKNGVFLGAVGSSERLDLLRVSRQSALAGQLEVAALPVPGAGRGTPSTRRSDHAPFWDKGVGAVMFTDTAELRNGHYHRPSDRSETLDPEFLQRSAHVIARVTRRLVRSEPSRHSP